MKRYKNGRYKSKRTYQLEQNIRLSVVGFVLLTALCTGFGIQSDTITWEKVYADTSNFKSLTDICGLNNVTCDDVDETLQYDQKPISELEKRIQQAIHDIPHETVETENRIRYLYEYAEGKDVNPDTVAKTIYCESMWVCTQSGIVKNGVQEPSYCIGQLHAPSHPEMTMEQLNDPYFNIRYMVDNFYNDVWYGYDRDTDTCASGVPEYW